MIRRDDFHLGFQLRSIVWILTYLGIFGAIIYKIKTKFQAIYEEVNIVQSVREYKIHMFWIMIITIALSIIWWYLARQENFAKLREKFDQNTILFALIHIIFVIIVAVFLNLKGYGLVDDLDNIYPLGYGYCFIFGYCTNMFLLPPSNVKLVILGGNLRRICVAIISGVIGCVVLFK